MKMKSCILWILLLFSLATRGQESLSGLSGHRFEIYSGNDTIEFIQIGTDLETAKPTILFCQGTLPVPLIIEPSEKEEEPTVVPFSKFNYQEIAENYHLILIAHPHTPVSSPKESLNQNFAYILDSNNEHSYHPEYLRANYMDKYLERGNQVIQFLASQQWVDKDRLFIVGHSQGAKIAVKLASENPQIAALGFLSGNPQGKVEQFIREYRRMQIKGEITAEEAQEKINDTYEWWKWLYQNPDRPSLKGEDTPKTTISFSTPVLPELLHLTIPVFIGYGTEDIGASYCDLLPLDFIRVGKANFKLIPYLGLEQNYCELDNAGNPIPEKCHWDRVMTDFINWLESPN